MELTKSYERVFSPALRGRYSFAEIRNAATALHGTNPTEFEHLTSVLNGFWLTLDALTAAGGSKSGIAADLDLAFRQLGWREAGHETSTHFTLTFSPWPAGTDPQEPVEFDYTTEGHKVDNYQGRVALDVEWNAKDGNLDRDLANFRALHDLGVIDVGVIITRHQERTKWAANYLAAAGDRIRYDTRTEKRIVLLGTTTTTNMEKLVPKLERGDAGGCPILAIALTELCYRAGKGEPSLPSFPGSAAAIPDPETDSSVVAAEPDED